jgi:general secretion pathway protein G
MILLQKSTRRSRAFTLLEIMVVMIILVVLAATIIPQFIGTTYDAKVSAAKGHIAELESAVERFYIHMDRYPTMEEGLKALVQAPSNAEGKWRGPYINLLRSDPWDHAYEYRVPGTHNASRFDIWSRGPDSGTGQGKEIGNW